MGCLDYLEDKGAIIRGAFFFQAIGGFGNGINTPSTVAVLSAYKDKRELYIGLFEIIGGLGCLFGPILGTFFYHIGGYKAPFFAIASIYLQMVIVFLGYSIIKSREDSRNKCVSNQAEDTDDY